MRLMRHHPVKFHFTSTRAGDNGEIRFLDLSRCSELSDLLGTEVTPEQLAVGEEFFREEAEEFSNRWQSEGRYGFIVLDPAEGEAVAAMQLEVAELSCRILSLQDQRDYFLRQPKPSEDAKAAADLIQHVQSYGRHGHSGHERIKKLRDQIDKEDLERLRSKTKADGEDTIVYRMILVRTAEGYTLYSQEGRSRKRQLGSPNCYTYDWHSCGLGEPGTLIGDYHGTDEVVKAIVEDVSGRTGSPAQGWRLKILGEAEE